MSSYIKLADALRALSDTCYLDEIDENMQKLPSIEIVFCKECKHRINDDDFQEKHICLLRRANGGKFCRDDDFCSYGERREP